LNLKPWQVLIGFVIFFCILSSCVAKKTSKPRNTISVIPSTRTIAVSEMTKVIETKAQEYPSITVHTLTLNPRQISIQEMLAVVEVVEKYYAAFGYYPKSIDDLIPEYLDKKPFTNEGFEILYFQHKLFIYVVKFYPAKNNYCSYTKNDGTWECGFFVEP
jgi:hypothetical protein